MRESAQRRSPPFADGPDTGHTKSASPLTAEKEETGSSLKEDTGHTKSASPLTGAETISPNRAIPAALPS